MESTLSSPYSRSDTPSFSPRCRSRSPFPSPFSRSGDLDRWICSFWQRRLWRTVANCYLFCTEALFSFHQTQYVQVFPLKPATFCKLFAGLDSPYRSATFLLFSSYLILTLSSSLCLCFYLNLSSRSGRNCLLSPPVLSCYNGSPDTRFSQETMQLMSRLDGERYSCPLQSLVVSLVSTLLGTGGVLSHLNSSTTHRFA